MYSQIAKFNIPEKLEVVNFNSKQKVQRLYSLTGTTYHAIVSGDLIVLYEPIWSCYSYTGKPDGSFTPAETENSRQRVTQVV